MGHIWPQFIVVSILAAFLPSPLLERVRREAGFARMRTRYPYRCTRGEMLVYPHNTTSIATARTWPSTERSTPEVDQHARERFT